MTTTIQATSKSIKLQQVVAGILFWIGMVALIIAVWVRILGYTQSNRSMYAWGFIVGAAFAWRKSVAVLKWWRHE
jgi:hypothetical protein